MADAKARGWGGGWPADRSADMVTVRAGGIKLRVHRRVAPIFTAFVDEIVERGYRLDAVADDWGYANRPIRKSNPPKPSNHSWGLAIDLNATTNPQSSRLITDMPDWLVELAETKYSLGWGGRYRRNPDAMHFEFLGTPAEADAVVARLGKEAPANDRKNDDEVGDDVAVILHIKSKDSDPELYWVTDGLTRRAPADFAEVEFLRDRLKVRIVEATSSDANKIPLVR